jgi:hypothetical protein
MVSESAALSYQPSGPMGCSTIGTRSSACGMIKEAGWSWGRAVFPAEEKAIASLAESQSLAREHCSPSCKVNTCYLVLFLVELMTCTNRAWLVVSRGWPRCWQGGSKSPCGYQLEWSAREGSVVRGVPDGFSSEMCDSDDHHHDGGHVLTILHHDFLLA